MIPINLDLVKEFEKIILNDIIDAQSNSITFEEYKKWEPK